MPDLVLPPLSEWQLQLCRELAEAVVGGSSAKAIELRTVLFTENVQTSNSTSVMLPDPILPGELDSSAGIYLISSETAGLHYVGLATDLRERFLSPGFGHLTNNKCRSAQVIEHDDFVVRVLSTMDIVSDTALALAEIETYVRLREAGMTLVNSTGMLGRTAGGVGSAVVGVDLNTGEYSFFGSLSTAVQATGSTAIAAAAHGYQRTAAGMLIRWATEAEVEAADAFMGTGASRAAWIASAREARVLAGTEETEVTRTGEARSEEVNWRAGLAPEDLLSAMRVYCRGTYSMAVPQSPYLGVSWHRGSRAWQYRAKMSADPKDIVQPRSWVDDGEAARLREEQIMQNGWQQWNTGRYGSNADRLNARFGTAFPGW